MADLTVEQLKSSFMQAHAAGDKKNAQIFADKIRQVQSQGQPAPSNDVQTQPVQQPAPANINEANNQALTNLQNKVRTPKPVVTQPTINQPVIDDAQTVSENVQKDDSFNPLTKKLFSFFSDASDVADDITDVASVAASGAVDLPSRAIQGYTGAGNIAAQKIGNLFRSDDNQVDALDAGVKTINAVKEKLSINPTADAQDVLSEVMKTAPAQWISEKVQGNEDNFVQAFGDIGVELLGEDFRAAAQTTGKTFHELFKLSGEVLTGGAGRTVKKGLKARSDAKAEVKAEKKADLELEKETEDFSLSSDEVKKVVTKQFDDIKAKDISVETKDLNTLNKNVTEEIKKITYSDKVTKKTKAIMDDLQQDYKKFKKINIVDLQNKRSQLGKITRGTDTTDAAAAQQMITQIDKTLDNVKDVDFREARRNDFKRRKLKSIEAAAETADLDTDARDRSFNVTIKAPIKQLIKKDITKNAKDQGRVFNPNETKALNKILKHNDTTVERFYNVVNDLNPSGVTALTSPARFVFNTMTGGLSGKIGKVADAALDSIKSKNLESAKRIVAAGNNADDIVKAYFKNTPKADRNYSELTGLLLKENVKDLNKVKIINKEIRQSVSLAKRMKSFGEEFSKNATIKDAAAIEAATSTLKDEESK